MLAKGNEHLGIGGGNPLARSLLALALLSFLVIPAAGLASAADPTTTFSAAPSAAHSNTLFVLPSSIVTLTAPGATTSYRLDNDSAVAYAGPFDLSALSEGNHTLAYWSTAGNATEAEQTVNLTIDATPPDLTIERPSDYSWISADTVHLGWTAYDAGSGPGTMQVRLDGRPWLDPMGPGFYDFVGLPDGKHILAVRATDALGLHTDAFVRVTVDTTGPVVTVLAPSPGQIATRALPDLAIVWEAKDRDSGLARVELIMDGGKPVDVTNRTSYPWHLPAEGTHSFVLRATDTNGFVTQAGASFTVTNDAAGAAPSSPSASGPDFFSVVLLTIVAMAVGAALPGLFRPVKGAGAPAAPEPKVEAKEPEKPTDPPNEEEPASSASGPE